MFPWKSTLIIETDSSRPKYLQISDQMIREITKGRLQPAQKIPGSRKMAELLGLSRKTVIQAYEELMAQGWLEIRSSSGTYIVHDLPVTSYIPLENPPIISPLPETNAFDRYPFIESYTSAPDGALQIDGGSPDYRIAPIDWIFKECRSIAKSRAAAKLLAYSDVRGDVVLRETLADYLSQSKGMQVGAENLLITRGSQMGIFLSIKGLIDPGDKVVVGSTSYDAADWAVRYHGGELLRVTVDDHGINTDELARCCDMSDIKLVYVTPHHHFPTTVTLSNARRIRLLELAMKYNFTILEDDYDYDFHYSSSPLLPLASLDHGGRVMYVGSFSKIFAPNLRVGYLVGAPGTIERVSKIRRIIDRQGDHILERVMAEAIKTGELNRHLKKSIQIYRQRRDFLATLMSSALGDRVTFKVPEGGMAIWTVFQHVPLVELGPYMHQQEVYPDIDKQLSKEYNALRIGFASLNSHELEKAVSSFSTAIKRWEEKHKN